MQVSQFWMCQQRAGSNKNTDLSNSFLHDTLSGVHAVSEFHLMHPQFGRCWKAKSKSKITLQSKNVIQSLHPIIKGALHFSTHPLSQVHNTFSARSQSLLIQSCRANDPFCGARRYGLPAQYLCWNWGRGRKPPPRAPRTHRLLPPRFADRVRYESTNTRSIFCKQVLFSSSDSVFS